MAVDAPILPPAPDDLDLPEHIRGELRQAWAAWWEPLRDNLRDHPPCDESSDERLAVARFARGLVELTTSLGDVLVPLLLRTGFSRVFEQLVLEESQQAPTEKKLGLKFVEQAVNVLSLVFEASTAFAAPNLPADASNQLLPQADEELARLLDPVSVSLLRLELYTFIAFDLVNAEQVSEFVEWARRARAASQAAFPHVARLAALSRPTSLLDLSPDLVMTSAAFTRVTDLIDNPPPPSERLAKLLGRGAA